MKKTASYISEDVLMGYLEGVLDAGRHAEVQQCLQRDKRLGEDLGKLRSQEQELVDLGTVLRMLTPGIHIGDSVLRTIKEHDTWDGALESELTELGVRIRDGITEVNLAAGVTAALGTKEAVIASTPVETDLMVLGEVLRDHVPGVDLVAPILDVVNKSHSARNGYIETHGRGKASPRRRTPLSWPLIGLAAVLLLCLGFLTLPMLPVDTDGTKVARQEESRQSRVPGMLPENPSVPVPDEKRSAPEKPYDDRESLLSLLARSAPSKEPSTASDGKAVSRAAFTVQDVLAAKRKALENQAGASAMLARWGSLDPDDVRRLLSEESLTTAQIAGMSRFLTDEEAVDLLKEVVDRNPDNMTVRLALAMQLMEDPAATVDALEQLATLKEQDPENALLYYMDAKLRFSLGDYASGLSLLESAAELNQGSAYGITNAQYNKAALEAGGIPAELAGTVAAFYAGTDEYAAVSALKADLLAQGATLEAEGNFEGALSVYKSVGEMGRQVSQGAAYTNEYLAGLDTQMDAVEAMNALASLVQVPGGLQTIQEVYDLFLQGLDIFLEYTRLLTDVTRIDDGEAVREMVESVLENGDIQYLQNMAM